VHVTADEDGDARIMATAFLGAATRLTVRLADGTEVKADLPTHEAAPLGAGAAVRLSLPERPVLVAERTV
jgi:putative spermidine/putrescine transport system ATP-binding protein